RDMAITLGVDYEKETKELLMLVSVLISISTALVGPITFLGILVVNLARSIMKGYEHKNLMIISSLISIVFLIVGQTILERFLNFSTPISVMINFIGGIYFIYLLLKENTK
ncbi:MAG TPA: iron chelate uptake ABC transporter family permease subunit, partial [Tissierellaceae bacterium]